MGMIDQLWLVGGCPTWGDTLTHMGRQGVPHGETRCPTWGDKNIDSMDSIEIHGTESAVAFALTGYGSADSLAGRQVTLK